jgi:4-hydroxy-tetrahydrodipicolinate synthase
MPDRTMRGLYPILAMPFDEGGRIDVEDLQCEVEFAIRHGAHGVGIAMASEIYKLSEAERDLATVTVVEQMRGRVKVVVNTGAQGTDLAVQYSRRAEELGADAVMVSPPSVMAVTGDEMRGYYRSISDAVDVPIFMQDQPAAPVAPALAAQIARESENACYAKVETPPTAPRVAQAVEAGGGALIVFGGAGGNMLIEELRRGAAGTMPHCAAPELFRRAWDLYQDGAEVEAQREFDRFAPLLRTISQGGGPSSIGVVKELLRLRGVFKAAHVRQPATPLDALAAREVRGVFETLGLSRYSA